MAEFSQFQVDTASRWDYLYGPYLGVKPKSAEIGDVGRTIICPWSARKTLARESAEPKFI